MDKKTYMIIGAGIAAILAAFLIRKILTPKEVKEEPKVEIKLVESYSDFFTVNGCASKYINYLTSEDKDSLIKVLNENYASKKNITKENILTKLDNFAGRSLTYSATKMYEEKVSDTIKKYYLKGNLNEDTIDSITKVGEYYLIVTIDSSSRLFDITPYDGEMFKEES